MQMLIVMLQKSQWQTYAFFILNISFYKDKTTALKYKQIHQFVKQSFEPFSALRP